jgi:hypothetical protein
MKQVTINRRNPAAAERRAAKLTPRPHPPAERYTHEIVLSVFGKRLAFTHHVEVREITRGPAKVIEMPIRATIEP